MITIKVGMMPGRLEEIVVEENTSARKIFELAGIEVSNHEIRLDGEKIDIDSNINSGNLLVAMKMIKGNMPVIKVGMMPGRLESIEYTEGQFASEIFEKANIELSNHEIRLDGEKINIDTRISGGNLLVAMKMIKGNSSSTYKTDCTPEEVEILLGVKLPTLIDFCNVLNLGNSSLKITINNEELVVEKSMFDSIYILNEEDNVNQVENIPNMINIQRVDRTMQVLTTELAILENDYIYHKQEADKVNQKITYLKELIQKLKHIKRELINISPLNILCFYFLY